MNTTNPLQPRLSDLPLWRLLVALDDAERAVGPDSPTSRALARAVQERLRQLRRNPTAEDERESEVKRYSENAGEVNPCRT